MPCNIAIPLCTVAAPLPHALESHRALNGFSLACQISFKAGDISLSLSAMLTIDAGNLGGEAPDNCRYLPAGGSEYEYIEPITFRIVITVKPTELFLGGAMIGIWHGAFGLDFLAFGNAQLGLGITVAAGLPAVSIGATVYIGNDCFARDPATGRYTETATGACFMAAGLAGINPSNPAGNYVYVGFKGLTVMNMVEVFLPGSVASWCRENLPQVLKDTGFPRIVANGVSQPNPEFSFSGGPAGVTALTGQYIPGGVMAKGKLNILGFTVQAELRVNPVSGITAKVELPTVNFAGGLVKLYRSKGDSSVGPLLDVDIRYGLGSPIPSVKVIMKGYVSLLGLEAQADVEIDSKGFHIFVELSLFGMSASLAMSANYGIVGNAFFKVRGHFKNDLFERLRAIVDEAFGDAKKAVSEAIEGAKDEVEASRQRQAEVTRLEQQAISRLGASLRSKKLSEEDYNRAKAAYAIAIQKKEEARLVISDREGEVERQKQVVEAQARLARAAKDDYELKALTAEAQGTLSRRTAAQLDALQLSLTGMTEVTRVQMADKLSTLAEASMQAAKLLSTQEEKLAKASNSIRDVQTKLRDLPYSSDQCRGKVGLFENGETTCDAGAYERFFCQSQHPNCPTWVGTTVYPCLPKHPQCVGFKEELDILAGHRDRWCKLPDHAVICNPQLGLMQNFNLPALKPGAAVSKTHTWYNVPWTQWSDHAFYQVWTTLTYGAKVYDLRYVTKFRDPSWGGCFYPSVWCERARSLHTTMSTEYATQARNYDLAGVEKTLQEVVAVIGQFRKDSAEASRNYESQAALLRNLDSTIDDVQNKIKDTMSKAAESASAAQVAEDAARESFAIYQTKEAEYNTGLAALAKQQQGLRAQNIELQQMINQLIVQSNALQKQGFWDKVSFPDVQRGGSRRFPHRCFACTVGLPTSPSLHAHPTLTVGCDTTCLVSPQVQNFFVGMLEGTLKLLSKIKGGVVQLAHHVAEGALVAVDAVATGVLEAAEWITKAALGGILDITEIEFYLELSQVRKQFRASISATVFSKWKGTVGVDVDLDDMWATVKNIIKSAFSGSSSDTAAVEAFISVTDNGNTVPVSTPSVDLPTACAAEGGQCSCSSGSTVVFGRAQDDTGTPTDYIGVLAFPTVSVVAQGGPVACIPGSFRVPGDTSGPDNIDNSGDPAPGMAKRCFCMPGGGQADCGVIQEQTVCDALDECMFADGVCSKNS